MDYRPSSVAKFLWDSVLARPLTTLYVIAYAVIIAGSAGLIELNHALTLITVIFVVLLVLGLHRENRIEARIVKAEIDSIRMMLINSALIDEKDKPHD